MIQILSWYKAECAGLNDSYYLGPPYSMDCFLFTWLLQPTALPGLASALASVPVREAGQTLHLFAQHKLSAAEERRLLNSTALTLQLALQAAATR